MGNPSPEYDGTRHNLGKATAAALATHLEGEEGARSAADGGVEAMGGRLVVAHGGSEGFINCTAALVEKVTRRWLREGETLVPATAAEGTSLLLLCDDTALDVGRCRLRASGGTGGHNGIADVLAHLPRHLVPRLRLGVGRPPPGRLVEHVLAPLPPHERRLAHGAVRHACTVMHLMVEEGFAAAQALCNAPAPPKEGSRGE